MSTYAYVLEWQYLRDSLFFLIKSYFYNIMVCVKRLMKLQKVPLGMACMREAAKDGT